ncbi:MAG: HAD-IA family hydrolase [Nitrospirae bacterium]|nr:HAD-IA family hydrolase [Nitrospirota bacterium]MBF0534016.1 HAD-IA family hydrolase [Nitrospirota bacterium]MBF0616175.1 HAD-IA family hydrolase [Nitrospirota bacterium]
MSISDVRAALWGDNKHTHGHITHVLLDMDGTLIDKYFDDYFWKHLVPQTYAERHNISFGSATGQILALYKHHEGTLNWTDIDFWTEQLGIDIPALKEQIHHLVDVHPHVEDFLKELRKHKKHVVLTTNAHYKTIAFKMKKTALGKYFDKVITSLDMGVPKEYEGFWISAQQTLGFNKKDVLFIDDTLEVARSAAHYGIEYVLIKNMASSREITSNNSELRSIDSFDELLPG